jgi:hypothetical protein
MPAFTTRRRALSLTLAVFVLCLATSITARAQMKTTTNRTISGLITDDSHEPLRGAVVELENTANHEIISFLTQADGRYEFKRVDSHTDFQLWATFRGHRSPVHNISMFDDHLDKVINIQCKTY